MKVRGVIFDLGGVVLDSPFHVFRQYESDNGLASGALSDILIRAGEAGAWSRLERGELEAEAFFAAFDAEAAVLGTAVSGRTLLACVDAYCRPRPAMLTAIRRLRAAGLQVAALTNNWKSEAHGATMALLRPEFDVFVESSSCGLRKPDPRIYMLACEKLGVSPEALVFLDDIGTNLKAARALGMTTIKVGADPADALDELAAWVGISLRAT